MSLIAETKYGRIRNVNGDSPYLLECPGCGEWLPLTRDMWVGEISVNHAADGCPGGYHETHPFADEAGPSAWVTT